MNGGGGGGLMVVTTSILTASATSMDSFSPDLQMLSAMAFLDLL